MIRSRMFVAASVALLVGVSSADAQHRGGGRARGGAVVVGRAAPRGEVRAAPRVYSASRVYAAPRGVRRAPIRFYQPYYTFRPRLSLGFGLSLGYPVRYTSVLRLLRSVPLPVLSLRIRVSVPVSSPYPYSYPSTYPAYPPPAYPPSTYPPGVSAFGISAFGISAGITATGISPVGVSAAGIDQAVAAEYRRHQLRDSTVGCTGLCGWSVRRDRRAVHINVAAARADGRPPSYSDQRAGLPHDGARRRYRGRRGAPLPGHARPISNTRLDPRERRTASLAGSPFGRPRSSQLPFGIWDLGFETWDLLTIPGARRPFDELLL